MFSRNSRERLTLTFVKPKAGVQSRGRLMPPTNTGRRLSELLRGLGCLDDIAPSNTPLIAKRTGELIAQSAISRKLEVTMTYPDPYNDRIRNPDDPWHREWGTGSMLIGIVAIVIMAVIIAFGASNTSTNTATGPSSTISQHTSTGQGR
jgi:hypothetical protein